MCTKILPEFFKRFEDDLSQKIRTGKDPFLGLFADYLGSATRNLLLKELRSSSCPAENFIENLRYYPALISTLLIGKLLEAFGQHGYFEVYPIFEELFGDSLASTTTKQKLWKNFRRACLSLGLPVSHRLSGAKFMVEEYLYQAGLPLRYVENFTRAALRYASHIGLPDEDDPEEIKLWQQGLVSKLTPPFPVTARKAVENDDGCYYTCIFTRLLTSSSADEDGLSIFEKRMRQAIQDGQTKAKVFRTAIPHLVVRDLEYGVLLPDVEEATWKITISYHDNDEETKIFTSYGEERFEPFGEELPADVSIENNSGFKWQYRVWEDEKNNRLLIFSQPDGKLVSRSSLAEKEIYLSPGNYRLLQRFPTAGDDGLEPMSEEPALYVREINLLPGSVIPISRGPATLQIKPHNIPALNWIGDPLRGIRGNELYPAQNLQLAVSLPAEFLASDHDFELRFKSAELGDEIILEPEVEPNGQVNIDVAGLWREKWRPGVSRVVASLYRRGGQRALAKTSAVVWHGLTRVEKRVRFYCEQWPENLEADHCVNLKRIDEDGYYTFHDESNRFFKMVFQDGKRRQQFTWSVPGIFLSLLTFTNHENRERSIPPGSTIAVNPTSQKVLQIFATNPGRLQLGSFNLLVNFSRLGSRKIPLAGLLEYVGADGNTLTFTDKETEITVPLVSLVAPCTALEFATETSDGLRKVSFATASDIEAVKITADNLASGEKYHLELSADTRQGKLLPENNVTMFCESERKVALYFELSGWLPGLWVIEFAVLTAGRWGTLGNGENGIFADGLMFADDENAKTKEEVYQLLFQGYGEQKTIDIFGRIHRMLQHGFASESWNNLAWLEWFWAKLYGRLGQESDLEIWLQLLRLACRWPDDTFMEGLVPNHNLGATLPKMFSLPRETYQAVNDHSSSLLSCISFLPKLADFMGVIRQQDIDVALPGGFANFAMVAVGQAEPEKFSLVKYQDFFTSRDFEERRRLLNNDQWLPGKGDFLGPMHYRYAFTKLRKKFAGNQTVESGTRGKALSMVRKVSDFQPSVYAGDSSYTNLDRYVLNYLQPEIDPENDVLTDEEAVQWEHLHHIERFLSLFAHACRCDARFQDKVLPALERLLMENFDFQYLDLKKIIGYLLFLGEEIFAFYLLLWEAVFTADCD